MGFNCLPLALEEGQVELILKNLLKICPYGEPPREQDPTGGGGAATYLES